MTEFTMTGTQYRAADVEHMDPDAGTILVRAVPYGVEAQVAPQVFETFKRGAFGNAANAPHRVSLHVMHDPTQPPIGKGLTVEDRRDGAWLQLKFSGTARALEARELAKDGVLPEVSVEFRALDDGMTWRHLQDGVHVQHHRAHLLGVALVPHGAYGDGAHVAQVRGLDAALPAVGDVRRAEVLAHLRALVH